MYKEAEAKGLDAYFLKCAEDFCIDYDPLEYLLIALIDAKPGLQKSRRNRLRDAYQNVTGDRRDRADEPDIDIAKAMYEYERCDEEDNINQLKPEHGGPIIETEEDERRYREKTTHGLACAAADAYGDRKGNMPEYVYKRVKGTYRNKLIQEDPNAYLNALHARYALYDRAKEKQLFEDLKRVAEILGRHGIDMDLTRAFWRVAS